MGSGWFHLAQITEPAKDNSKGARGSTRNFLKAPRPKFHFSPATLPDRKVRKPERASALMRRVFLFNHDHGQ